jgi:dynein light intermediate chain 1
MSGQKLWDKILRDSSQSKRYSEGNLILVGRPGSGIKSLISELQLGPGSLGTSPHFTNLLSPKDQLPSTSPLEYSYINSKDPADNSKEKLSKVNVYSLEQPELKSLLSFALNSKSLDKTLFGIVLDWEQPWRFTQDLETWTDIWHETLGKVLSSLPLEEQDKLVKNVEDYVKSYRPPGTTASILQDLPPLTEGVLTVNLGIPILVICNKSELVWTLDKNPEQNEKMLDVALKTLREFCVTYAASLFYVSTSTKTNLGVLYDYLMHRLYGFNFGHKPDLVSRDMIFVPSGLDSPSLINEMNFLTGDKQFHEMIQRPKNRVCNKEELTVVSDQEHLLLIKEKLESGRKSKMDSVSSMVHNKKNEPGESRDSINATADGSEPKPQAKLQMFYQMLLDKNTKDKV